MVATMVPGLDLRPDVLPSERLLASGKPVPQLRGEMRRIPNLLNAKSLLSAWVQIVGVIVAAAWISHPLAWIAAFFLMGRHHTMLGVLSHEAAHNLLFAKPWLNNLAGRWLTSYPTFISFDGYRRGHFSHHKDEMGPKEPDLLLYTGYPISRASLTRKLRRDASGVSGYKILKSLFRGFRTKPHARTRVLRIYGTQVTILAVFAAFGRPELYPFLWLAPWMTVTRVTARLRAIAEHGGMARSKDRRETTSVVRQSRLANFWMVPYNTGWHLAHHVDMGVPWRELPELHHELVAAGYVVPALEYSSYRALWSKSVLSR